MTNLETAMSSSPLEWLDTSEITILYLAKHAPLNGSSPPRNIPHPEYGMAEAYNHEIFFILQELGFKVISTRNISDILSLSHDVHYVFSLYNRAPFRGSEILVSSLCEFFGTPYLGAPPHIRALAEDKHLAKALARHLYIPTPKWILISGHDSQPVEPDFPGPYFVKPRFGAASQYIDEHSIQDLWVDALRKARELSAVDQDVIIEKFSEGTNATIPLLGGEPPFALPVVQNSSLLKGEVITGNQKKMPQGGLKRSIMKGPQAVTIQDLSVLFYTNASPMDYTRIDFRVPYDVSKPPLFLEFNVCPNLGSHSTIVLPAAELGLTQKMIIARILDYSFRRQKFCPHRGLNCD